MPPRAEAPRAAGHPEPPEAPRRSDLTLAHVTRLRNHADALGVAAGPWVAWARQMAFDLPPDETVELALRGIEWQHDDDLVRRGLYVPEPEPRRRRFRWLR